MVTAKRIFFGIVIVAGICQMVFPFLYPTLKIGKLEQSVHDLKGEIRKNDNESLYHFINERISAAIQQLKTENKSAANPEQELRQSFEAMRDHIYVLILKVGNLSAFSTMNSSSDSKMSRLFWKLNATKNKLVRLRTKLTKLNYSVQNYIMPFVSKAVNDLRQELNILSNSTTASISELRKYWSRAGAEVEETRRGIQNSVDNRIAQANKTLHEALEDAVQSLHSSLAKVDAKVNKLQKRTNVLIDEVKDDLSKAKAKFQKNDRKHDQAISGAARKMESVQNRVTKLEGERNSDIQTIDELKNERNSDMEKWNWNKQMIVIFVCLGINFLLTLILFKVYCCK
jgi:ElaB/YqjD/DUF883 family membrane-anchored ribosome-binding protein